MFSGIKSRNYTAQQIQQFQVVPSKILGDTRTSLMIRNIPNKYTQVLLKETLDKNLPQGSYNFLYLPIDFSNSCNVGYAFINMTTVSHVSTLYFAFNGKKWEHFRSEKICEVSYARLQGLKKMKSHFQSTKIAKLNDNKVKPIIFK